MLTRSNVLKANTTSAQSSESRGAWRIFAQGSTQGLNPSGSKYNTLMAIMHMSIRASVHPCVLASPAAQQEGLHRSRPGPEEQNLARCSSNPGLAWAKSPDFRTTKWVKMCRIRLQHKKISSSASTTAILACQFFLIARLTAMWWSRHRQVLVISSVLPIPILLRQWHIKNSFHLFIYCMLGKLCHQLLVWKKKKKKPFF